MTDLRELIGEYWNLAYKEGVEGRTHDTEAGDGQRVWLAINAAITAMEAEAERLTTSRDAYKHDAEALLAIVKAIQEKLESIKP